MKEWTKAGFESVVWSLLGNLLPLWLLAVIALAEHGFDSEEIYASLHQPFTYLILSGSFLTSAYYNYSKLSERKNDSRGFFPFIFFLLLIIIGYLVAKKPVLEDLSASFSIEVTVIIIFILSVFSYIYYQFKYYYDIHNPQPAKKREKDLNSLKSKFASLGEQS